MSIGPDSVRKAASLRGLTRRQFARTAAGTAALGGALGSGLFKSGLAKERASSALNWSFAPVPIPVGTPALNGFYHFFAPAPTSPTGDPVDAEPSTITNLDGFVGLAMISGMVTRINTQTGEKLRLPFQQSDMRFMKGNFRGTDGNIHEATFAFVWLEVYQLRAGDQTETQIHELNPTQFPPVGLFWTIELPEHSVEVELEKGRASLQAFHVPILDYGDVTNALFGGGPKPISGSVSFRVVWSGMQERVDVRNTDPVFGGFTGQFIRNKAQMEWTAVVGDYRFVSDPLETSSSTFAEIGSERNGSFFS